MNKNMATGFKDEMEKISVSVEDGVKGLGVGAILGAVLSAVGTEALEKLVTRNKDLAIITGAIMGAGALGGAGYLLGGNKGQAPVTNATGPSRVPGTDIYQGSPPPGMNLGGVRHMP